VFVKLMDYKNSWLSNYGRVIRLSNGKYNLLEGSYDDYGALFYSLIKNIFFDGKWVYKGVHLYAAKAVVEEFIVNPDKANNVYIWHSGFDKQDHYYRNLYSLNQEQYKIVKNHFNMTGEDSEDFLLKLQIICICGAMIILLFMSIAIPLSLKHDMNFTSMIIMCAFFIHSSTIVFTLLEICNR